MRRPDSNLPIPAMLSEKPAEEDGFPEPVSASPSSANHSLQGN
jgi:hypothetical protein